MFSNAKQLIKEHARGKTVAAAVSGGEDSMALLSLLLGFAQNNELRLIAVNVDHRIRKNSSADSAFVEKFCAENNIKLIKKVVDIPALCRESGRGLESEAHFARKAFFEEIIKSGVADVVATAHHARDNAETVLMHLFRGAGLKGLSGMKILSGGIFRPFLTTPKEEISAYVKAHGIPFVIDETNADTDYYRNYIRHEILPRIEQRFPAAERAICRAAGFAAEADEFVSERLDGSAVCVNADGSVSLSENRLSAPYIFKALAALGKTADVYYSAIDSVQKLAEQKDCARVDIGGGVVAAREYGKITFYRKSEAANIQETALVLPEISASFRVGNNNITVEKVPHAGDCRAATPLAMTRGANCHCEERSDEAISCGRTLYFSADDLPENCVWRTRRAGDRFTPFGGGSKKLKEYLIDEKIPLRLRDSLALLCSGGEVLLIAGVQISDVLKVTADSKNVYRVTVSKE